MYVYRFSSPLHVVFFPKSHFLLGKKTTCNGIENVYNIFWLFYAREKTGNYSKQLTEHFISIQSG